MFEHATLAMDATSCQDALDSLIHQGLVHMASNQYTITASGVQTLIPAKRDGKFPTGTAQSYMDVLPPVVTPATLQVVTKNGVCTITKDDVSIQLSAEEIQQLWKKLLREADQNN